MAKKLRAQGYLQRMLYAMLPAFLLSFIYTLFTPIDVIVSNESYFSYSWHDLIWPLVGICVVTTLLLGCFSALFHGEVFEKLILGIVGISIGSYVQYMFLNPDFGVLDGAAILWHTYAKEAIFNLLIWAGIMIVLFVLKAFVAKDTLHMISIVVCIVLIVAQAAGMTSLLMNSKPKSNQYLSAKDRLTVSGKDNIIIFYLDNLSNELFDDIVINYPDVAEKFKDFTYYDNANCSCRVTFPGMATWMTGIMYDGTQSVEDYFQSAWENENTRAFYATLREKNYAVNLYPIEYTVTDNIQYLQGIADNIEQRGHATIDKKQFLSLYKLSAFRSFPLIMKAPMWVSTDEIQSVVLTGQENTIKDDYHFISDFRKKGLTTDPEKNYYIVQYLTGAHSPFRSDENGNYTSDGSDELRQTTGYLRMVAEYIDQLQKLGVYDRSTIIISADHGAYDRLQFVYLLKKPGDAFETMQFSNAPISPQLEHFGTIMSLLGEDGFGTSIFDYQENQVIERICTYPKKRDDYPLVNKYGTEVEGNYNVVYVIKYSGDRDTLAEQYKHPDEIIPMVDSFW